MDVQDTLITGGFVKFVDGKCESHHVSVVQFIFRTMDPPKLHRIGPKLLDRIFCLLPVHANRAPNSRSITRLITPLVSPFDLGGIRTWDRNRPHRILSKRLSTILERLTCGTANHNHHRHNDERCS